MNMTWFFDLLSTALYTVFIQNLVFNGGYAASEALMLAKKPRRLWMFSAMIAFFSTVTALACRARHWFSSTRPGLPGMKSCGWPPRCASHTG